ncbi:uncharacterized protein BJ212DRAFT_1407648 [Suillus subaureus]|uniref:Uncharacterized protein n=1 Tax=Suillus subaureus TaxID=48587 RepID=A0A9P7DJH9_9AGAM|nr:uncharacterized protein BJ212DRAFT_1407648 [Suillus subaureus]KAG1796590.1 hypothetical protein BJ212DRAFT_1407648 [Suillus subaureus]
MALNLRPNTQTHPRSLDIVTLHTDLSRKLSPATNRIKLDAHLHQTSSQSHLLQVTDSQLVSSRLAI